MRNPFAIIGTIPISGTATAPGSIPLVRARTVTITARITFPAQADVDATVKVYYSPDGNNWDTIVYTSFAVAFTASTTIQRSIIIDPPEHGYLMIKILNGSASVTISRAELWYTIQSWDEVGAEKIDMVLKREMRRQLQEETGQLEG